MLKQDAGGKRGPFNFSQVRFVAGLIAATWLAATFILGSASLKGRRLIYPASFGAQASGLAASAPQAVNLSEKPGVTWQFAVSGDSRDCGDVVMPAIAADALQYHPAFYWHLGDLRKIYDFDEDMQHQPEHLAHPMTIIDYESGAWDDFIQNQIVPFGSLPFFLGIGNHEVIPPKTRDEFMVEFGQWLNAPILEAQRLKDDPSDHRLHTYYHWTLGGIDFINLDNASAEQFDTAQVAWLEKVLARDEADASIRTIVVGMHRALPDSLSLGHSMSESAAGSESGRRVYADLVKAQGESRRRVYVLASHSHFFMDGVYNTDYWRQHGGVLPGWIVGTAGAVRYPLPDGSKDARQAMTRVYGYLLATVNPEGGRKDGEIRFEFHRLEEDKVPAAVTGRFTSDFVHWCFEENHQ